MAYIPSLEQVQVGLESSYGDGTAATITLVGIENFTVNPRVDAEQIVDKRGDTFPSHDSVVNKRWAEATLDGYLNYQQFYIVLDSLFGTQEPVGGVYSYSASGNWTGPAEQSIAFYSGQAGGLFKTAGALPTEVTITGSSGGPVKFSETLFGIAPVDGASFDASDNPSVDYAMGSHCALFLDEDKTANPGTSALADTAFSFEFRIIPNRKQVWHLGEIAPDSYLTCAEFLRVKSNPAIPTYSLLCSISISP